MSKSYCVFCNRGKPKGTWIKTKMLNSDTYQIETTKGTKFFEKGTCEKCGKKTTAIRSHL